MPTTTLLLDADIVAYEFASGAQKNYSWPGGVDSIDLVLSDEEILEKVKDRILSLQEGLDADRVIVCLSDPKVNFRKSLYPAYKGNRTQAKPVKLMWLKEQLAEKYETYQRPTLEADDVMGILSTHPKLIPGKKIIVSIDKDMKTIPGWLYNPDKDREPWLVTEEYADRFHLFQTLTGDPVDGYPGCPGIGKVKAEGLLTASNGEPLGAWSMWQAVVAAYEIKGLTEADALVQARCARILRASDYDFKKKEPILWNPKTT